jgi:multidrug efflux pump subunit AcrA (membrane-fusion protein)
MPALNRLIPRATLALAAAWLAACSSAPPSATATPSSAGPTAGTLPASAPQTVAAVVVPVRHAELSALIETPVRELAFEAGDSVAAGDAILVLDSPALELAVTGAQAAFTSAQVNAQLQRYSDRVLNDRGKWVYRTGPPELRQAADARAVEAQAALAVAQGELSQATLRAPFDATIAAVSIREGEVVTPGVPIVTVADLSRFRIETTDLSERDVVGLSIGQRFSAYIEALNQSVSVIVASISPKGESIDGDVLYEALLDFESQPAGLLWGMTAELTLTAP